MNNWLQYLLHVNIYLLLFYGLYHLLLGKQTFFNLNRIYLLITASMAFFMPFVQSEWIRNQGVTEKLHQTFTAVYAPMTVRVVAINTESNLTWGNILAVIYLSGILFFLGKFGLQMLYLGKLLRGKFEGKEVKRAFSFFGFLFISKELRNRNSILHHEQVHIRQLHSADVLLFELVAIFNWFNPVIYLYKKAIKHIHEYIADEISSRHEPSKEEYAMLLFNQQFGLQTVPLTNSFFNESLLKKRVKMLMQRRSGKQSLLNYILFIPVLGLTILLSSSTIIKKPIQQFVRNVEQATGTNFTNIFPQTTNSQILAENKLPEVLVTEASPIQNLTGVSNNPNANYFTENFNQLPDENQILKTLPTQDGIMVTNNNDNSILSEIFTENPSKDLLLPEPTKLTNSANNHGEITVMGYSEELAKDSPTNEVEGFSAVDEIADFPGGISAFKEYLKKSIRYPQQAQRVYAQGKVYVQFLVNADGSSANFSVIKGIGFGLDEEAVRVLKAVPKWNAAKHDGIQVKSRFTVPIYFIIGK
jgi:TonB family protein